MMKQMNKKGAVEITATAIVVFIIAIVVLGTVIYFIQSEFPKLFEIFGENVEKIKADLRERCVRGNDKICLPFGKEFTISSGETKNIYLGIKNDFSNPSPEVSDEVCFRVGLKCVKPYNKPSDKCFNTYVGGVKRDGSPSDSSWFDSANLLNNWDIRNSKADVKGPIHLQIKGASPDTYVMKVEVYKAQGEKSCGEQPSVFEPYETKEFSLTVQ